MCAQKKFPENKRILITGAGGFVGRNLTEFLSGNYDIFAASHKELELLDEKSVENFIQKNDINFIIHCANTGGSRVTGYDSQKNDVVEKNLAMFSNLAKCLTPQMRMIFFGSGAEYDKRNPLVKVREEDWGKSVPADDYGYSKYLISKEIAAHFNITSLRIFGLYGKYEDYRFKFISNAILKNLMGLDIVINQNVYFDYLFMEDFLQIVAKVVENQPKQRLLNITPSEKIDLVSIVEIINEISPNKSKIILKNEGLNNEYSASNKNLLKEIGGFEFTSYKNGIKKLYDYYKENLDTLDLQAVAKDEFLKYCKVNYY